LNCKPGDLAVVIKSEKVADTTGAIVRILRPYDGSMFARFGPAWWVEYQGQEHHGVDAFLRPIRDPGEDAQDETLNWLSTPVPEAA
jgi:hypothetical protein